ncbi:MAG: hypothetical protein ABIA75_08920 [Candidatus Neomarinimicrobiota bacterium]
MGTPTFAETISNGKVMLSGLRAHAAALAVRGIDAEFIGGFETDINACEQLNNEQEALKAGLKAKTAELNQQMQSLKARYGEANQLVKITIDHSLWLEFGITAKR